MVNFLDTGNGIINLDLDKIGSRPYSRSFGSIGESYPGTYNSRPELPKPIAGGGGVGLALAGLLGTAAATSGSIYNNKNRIENINREVPDAIKGEQEKISGYDLFAGSKGNIIKDVFAPRAIKKLQADSKTNALSSSVSGGMSDAQKSSANFNPDPGPNFELESFDQLMKPDVPAKTFGQKITGTLNKVFDSINDPLKNEQFMRGLRIYVDGTNGVKLGQALLNDSKFSKEQYKSLMDNAYKESQIQVNNAKVNEYYATSGQALTTGDAKLAEGLSYSDITSQIKNRISAEYFPGIDRSDKTETTFPNTQLDSISTQMVQDVNDLVKRNYTLNEAVDITMAKAEEQGALSRGKIVPGKWFGTNKVPARADASKYTEQRKSLKVLMANPKNKDYTEEEIRTYVNSLPNTILVD